MREDGAAVNAAEAALFVLRNANMQLTTDQTFSRNNAGFTKFVITKVIAVYKSGAVAALTAGGIYTAASKGGSALVAAAQAWTNLTTTNKIQDATLAAVNSTDAQTATPILNLTTGSSTAAVADIFIFGLVVD